MTLAHRTAAFLRPKTWWNVASIRASQRRSKALQDIVLRIMRDGYVSNHSSRGTTLAYIINELEEFRVPYTIEAVPGVGYTVYRNEAAYKSMDIGIDTFLVDYICKRSSTSKKRSEFPATKELVDIGTRHGYTSERVLATLDRIVVMERVRSDGIYFYGDSDKNKKK